MIISTREAYLGKRPIKDYRPSSNWVCIKPYKHNAWTEEFIKKQGHTDMINFKHLFGNADNLYWVAAENISRENHMCTSPDYNFELWIDFQKKAAVLFQVSYFVRGGNEIRDINYILDKISEDGPGAFPLDKFFKLNEL